MNKLTDINFIAEYQHIVAQTLAYCWNIYYYSVIYCQALSYFRNNSRYLSTNRVIMVLMLPSCGPPMPSVTARNYISLHSAQVLCIWRKFLPYKYLMVQHKAHPAAVWSSILNRVKKKKCNKNTAFPNSISRMAKYIRIRVSRIMK